jgi:hypothetical protein
VEVQEDWVSVNVHDKEFATCLGDEAEWKMNKLFNPSSGVLTAMHLPRCLFGAYMVMVEKKMGRDIALYETDETEAAETQVWLVVCCC